MGKTTFINTLFSTTIKNYADHKRRHQKQVDKTVEIEITKAELEEKFFKGTAVPSPDLPCRRHPSLSSVAPRAPPSADLCPSPSPLDRHRHPWLRRLRQQPGLVDAHHRVSGRPARVLHAPGTTAPPPGQDRLARSCLPLLHPPERPHPQATRHRGHEEALLESESDSRHREGGHPEPVRLRPVQGQGTLRSHGQVGPGCGG